MTDEQIEQIAARLGSRSLNITRAHELGGLTRTIMDPAGVIEFARAILQAGDKTKDQQADLSASVPSEGRISDALHAAIMNLHPGAPPVPDQDQLPGSAEVLWAQGYKFGHRDARHAAAELASEYAGQQAASLATNGSDGPDGVGSSLSRNGTKDPDYIIPHPTGVGRWCAPGPADQQVQRWLLHFEDRDLGINVYTDEATARRDFHRAEARGWNCHLLQLCERSPSPAAPLVAQDGWRLVPVEPTNEMVNAALHKAWENDRTRIGKQTMWAAVEAALAAAPGGTGGGESGHE
jgi:hypothetical protein